MSNMAVYSTPSLHYINAPITDSNDDSPPSLTYSDDISEVCDMMNSSAIMESSKDDINEVLDDVLVNTARIVEHLRDRGQNEAANRVSREMTSTFRYLYDTVASYTSKECIMKAPNAKKFSPVDSTDTPPAVPKASAGNSWAAIAATEPTDDRLIKYRPSDALKQKIAEQEPFLPQCDAQNQRVVWIQPWQDGRPVNVITNGIRQLGALYSIAYSPKEQSVCMIFQHAHCARQFMSEHAEFESRFGRSKFGHDITVLLGNPYPTGRDLQLMEHPYNERRRLTFARQQLFSHGLTEQQFKADLEDLVGASNVELVWLFNTGNATVVFSAVPVARMARNKFAELSKQTKSPYSGVMVSFSHDPCERDLHLVSQMPAYQGSSSHHGNGHHPEHRGSNGEMTPARRFTILPSTTNSTKRPTTRKHRTDADGWQTVGKRR